MSIKTVPITNTKIKIRYRETYLTQGANERASGIVRGLYRGFYLAPSGTPDKSVWLVIDPFTPAKELDPDQFAIYNAKDDSGDAYALSIRETASVELDLTSIWPSGTDTLYFYIEASYSTAAATAGSYNVSDEDPREPLSPNYNPYALLVGVITYDFSGGTIDFDPDDPATAAVLYYGRHTPQPTWVDDDLFDGGYEKGDQQWGAISGFERRNLPGADQKDAMDNASSPSSSNPFATESISSGIVMAEQTVVSLTSAGLYVQIPDTVDVYIGKSATDTAYTLQRFFDFQRLDSGEPLTSLPDGGRIKLQKVCLYGGTANVVPSSDADAEGFISGARLYFDFSATDLSSVAATFWVKYGRKKTLATLEQAPASALPVGSQQPFTHASDLVARRLEEPAYRSEWANTQEQIGRLANNTSGPLPRKYDMTDFVMQRRYAGKEDCSMYSDVNRFVVTGAGLNTVGPISVAYVDDKRHMYVINGDLTHVHKIDIEDDMTTVLTVDVGADVGTAVGSGTWSVLDSCVDDTYIYFRCYEPGGSNRHCVYVAKLEDLTKTSHASWPTPHVMLTGTGSGYDTVEPGIARIINASDDFIATNHPAITTSGSGTAAIQLINRNTKTLTTGEGNATSGYHPGGGISSDGTTIVWGAKMTGFVAFFSCDIANLATSTANIVHTQAATTPLDEYFMDIIFDGQDFWAGGHDILAQWDGSLGFGLMLDSSRYDGEWFGRLCFDGKRIWMARYGLDTGDPWYFIELAAVNPQARRGRYADENAPSCARIVPRADVSSTDGRGMIGQVFFDGIDVWVNVDPSGSLSSDNWDGEIRRLTQARDRG